MKLESDPGQPMFRQAHWQLTLWYSGVMGGVIVVAALVFAIWETHTRYSALESSITTLMHPLSEYVSAEFSPRDHSSDEGLHLDQNFNPPEDMFIHLYDPAGRLVDRRGRKDVTAQLFLLAGNLHWRIPAKYLVVRQTLRVNESIIGYLEIGRSIIDVEQGLQNHYRMLAFSVPILICIIGICGYFLAYRALKPILQTYEQLEHFTADVSHELRTPLGISKTLIQVLEQSNPDPKLTQLESMINRLISMVEDLLFLARLVEPQSKQPVDLAALLSTLVGDLEFLAADREVHLTLESDPVLPTALGYPSHLYRLFYNLVSNAIHYTPANGSVRIQTHWIEPSVFRAGEILVQIIDTGIGIPADALPHLFQRFYRVDSSRTREAGGSGLGLAIAQSIAQAHQGSIRVDSKPQQGSTFSVHLPSRSYKNSSSDHNLPAQ